MPNQVKNLLPSRRHQGGVDTTGGNNFERPKHIKFVTELPMTGVGKVDKKVLKAGFWVGRERMVG